MAHDALSIGLCHCETGRKRYHLGPGVNISWESPGISHVHHNQGVLPDDDDDDNDDNDDDDDDDDDDDYDDDDNIIPDLSADIEGPMNSVVLSNVDHEIDLVDTDVVPVDTDTMDTDNSESEPGSEPGSESESGSESETGDPVGSEGGVPSIALYRLNLTALSQRYNIYAAAYRCKIHISRVRSCLSHTLPSRPDLVLEPPETPESLRVGGYLDHIIPHQMNHLIIGDLGNAEILLVACDDGDVVGYYTSQIENALSVPELGGSVNRMTSVKPFFHQNVGKSAWGLAIHSKSRLIAVGTNKHEVHVFAFGLRDAVNSPAPESKLNKKLSEKDVFRLVRKPLPGNVSETAPVFTPDGKVAPDTRTLFSHSREYSYRIVLDTGHQGNNIPNVAFSNNVDGEAVEVLAVDITGKLWVLNIWTAQGASHWFVEGLYRTHARQMSPHTLNQRQAHGHPRGWGVLVLPESSFLPTKTFKDSLGLNPTEAVYVKHAYGPYIGIGKAVDHIKNNSKLHPWLRSRQLHRFHRDPRWRRPVARQWYNPYIHCPQDWTSARDIAADKSTKPSFSTKPIASKTPPHFLADGSRVMRTYETDIELMGGDSDNIGIMLDDLLLQKSPPGSLIPGMIFEPQRIANLIHVPELSLVVAGSMCGRVALITLTRPANLEYSFKRGLKPEAILPKKSDEDKFLRPICPLLGVAIGPIPSASSSEPSIDSPPGERRYRIMLHYYDHRILSYELYRSLATSRLSVV